MSTADLDHAWPRIRAELRQAVAESTWHLWLEPLHPARLDGRTLVLEAPDEIRPWIADRFGRLLQVCAATVLGADVTVDLAGPEPERRGADRAARQSGAPSRRHQPAGVAFNPRFTFDQFVIGDSNRLAHGAALAVAEMPGLVYNPLFICGPPGLGKTHLLHSIASYVSSYGTGLTVRYTTVEDFTDHFIAALHSGSIDAFKAAYRHTDLLLVDDVQFLQSKLRTEQEFFHTFNALLAAGAQLVLTSDRLPRDLDALEDRLRERFASGLVTDVRPPDLETRLTILRKRVAQDRLAGVDPSALVTLAERVTENTRALEGALIRVVAFGSLTGRRVDGSLAAEVVDGLYPELRSSRRTVGEIQQQTAAAFGISVDDLVSPSRVAHLAWARQVAMYLSRELTDQTLPAIGRAFGGRNHSTVLHAYRRTAERMAVDPEAFDIVRRLTQDLHGPAAADRPS